MGSLGNRLKIPSSRKLASGRTVEDPPVGEVLAKVIEMMLRSSGDEKEGGSAVSQTGFEGPEQMAFDSSGKLFVSDPFASRALEYSPPFSNGMAASLVLGQPDFTSSTPAAGTSGMNFPAGVALSPN